MARLAQSVALRRYLDRHIEPDLPDLPQTHSHWRHALVVPAYRERANLLTVLGQLTAGATGRVLIVLVLNRPDSDIDESANGPLRSAIESLPQDRQYRGQQLYRLTEHTDLYLLDLEQQRGALPRDMGVGLARKCGCDLVLRWMAEGAVQDTWICTSDADATLPGDYFERLGSIEAAAAVFPFLHLAGPSSSCNQATALYELRLHHYVLGLEHASSPYAFHTLGSCMAIDATAYAQVRGFPRRSGGEDFYLLNKIAKTGPVARLAGCCIALESRQSERVPFGTGPAVRDIVNAHHMTRLPLFYHPETFHALKILLLAVPALFENRQLTIEQALLRAGMEARLAQPSSVELQKLGMEAALKHCGQQGKSAQQFSSQFHQWFDGFRTLKFIHAMERRGWPRQTLAQLQDLTPNLWPAHTGTDAATEQLLECVRHHWGWTASA